MKLLVVGGGGREHAIIKKLKENKSIREIFALPGNGGIAADAACVNISATDIPVAAASTFCCGVNIPEDNMTLRKHLLFCRIAERHRRACYCRYDSPEKVLVICIILLAFDGNVARKGTEYQDLRLIAY